MTKFKNKFGVVYEYNIDDLKNKGFYSKDWEDKLYIERYSDLYIRSLIEEYRLDGILYRVITRSNFYTKKFETIIYSGDNLLAEYIEENLFDFIDLKVYTLKNVGYVTQTRKEMSKYYFHKYIKDNK